jgi:threonylcarbamoyladenosine tRNA methylthiotransferase MtaB
MSADGNRTATPEIVTFGCRLNTYESEVMRTLTAGQELEHAVIVNTCAVTNEATRQARQTIRRIARQRPDAKIVVTGCAAQIEPQIFAGLPNVVRVLGNGEKLDAKTWGDVLADDSERVLVNDIGSVRETALHLIDGFAERTRAYVQVQNGCDHRCTFCIIPYGRGPSRSVPAGEIVAQIRRLVEGGYKEVVLTGVDITAWGADLPGTPRLGRLVHQILAGVPELARLRLSSVDPVEIDEELITAFASEERLMPHLHLSLQAGDNMILKRMKRRHSREDAICLTKRLRTLRPEIAFGADIIAGFPTETDEMFAQSLALIEECGLAFTHVFPFSPKAGTPAARMPQLARPLIKERAARLRAEGERIHDAFLLHLAGTDGEALVETGGFGRLANFVGVEIDETCEPGSLVPVTLGEARSGHLRAQRLS